MRALLLLGVLCLTSVAMAEPEICPCPAWDEDRSEATTSSGNMTIVASANSTTDSHGATQDGLVLSDQSVDDDNLTPRSGVGMDHNLSLVNGVPLAPAGEATHNAIKSIQKLTSVRGVAAYEEGVTRHLPTNLPTMIQEPDATLDKEPNPSTAPTDVAHEDPSLSSAPAPPQPVPLVVLQSPAPLPHTTPPLGSPSVHDPESMQGVWIPIALAAGVVVTLWTWYRLASFLGALLSRILPGDVLRQPTRRRLFELLQDRRGLTADDAMAMTGWAEGTVRHHFRVLEHHGLIERKAAGRHVAFFASGPRGVGLAPNAALAFLRCPKNHKIALTVEARPGIHQGALAKRLTISQSRVHARTQRMIDLKLVKRKRKGRRVTYYPTRMMRQALAEIRGDGGQGSVSLLERSSS